jgi:hypothetical protein
MFRVFKKIGKGNFASVIYATISRCIWQKELKMVKKWQSKHFQSKLHIVKSMVKRLLLMN